MAVGIILTSDVLVSIVFLCLERFSHDGDCTGTASW